MLGSGIFVLPGLAAYKTGPMVWLAYLVAGLSVLPAALSKSELATAMPTSGGTYVYLERTFGPLAGTVSGLGLWLSLLLKSAFALVGFSAYLAVLVPSITEGNQMMIVSLVLLFGITVLNIIGVQPSISDRQRFGFPFACRLAIPQRQRFAWSLSIINKLCRDWRIMRFVHVVFCGMESRSGKESDTQ